MSNRLPHLNSLKLLVRASVLSAVFLFSVKANIPCAHLTALQIRAVASKPILDAYNKLTTAVGDAFDRDLDTSLFSQLIRQAVLRLLSEIKSGMLALIRNATGAHEGNYEDVPKIVPDIQALQQILQRDRTSEKALIRFHSRIVQILPTINRTEMEMTKTKGQR